MKILNLHLDKAPHRRLVALLMSCIMLLLNYVGVQAQSGQPVAPHDLSNAWNTELSILFPIEILIGIYALGILQVWLRAGFGHGIRYRTVAAFAGLVLVLFVALVSPLDALGHALFSAHMVQHLILILC